MDDETVWNILMRMARTPWYSDWDSEWTNHQVGGRVGPMDLWWPEAIGLMLMATLGMAEILNQEE